MPQNPFPDSDALLARARDLAECIFAPNAAATDRAALVPAHFLHQLAESGLLALTTPRRYGGAGASDETVRSYIEILAAACGVTTFTQGQHLSACALIAGGDNDDLKRRALPALACGDRFAGVSFAHLRRAGPPVMRAACDDGDAYILDGTAPWFTGYGLFHDVVLGATLPDGNLLYCVTPLKDDGALTASSPMALCAMNASGTVSLTARGLRIPGEMVLKVISREKMASNDLAAILVVAPQIFGVTIASIRILRQLASTRTNRDAAGAADALDTELAANRRRVERWRGGAATDGYRKGALAARAAITAMAVRAAHAAVAATGGGANSLLSDAQRLFREAMFYTLIAQTRDIQAATLERIAADAGRASRWQEEPSGGSS